MEQRDRHLAHFGLYLCNAFVSSVTGTEREEYRRDGSCVSITWFRINGISEIWILTIGDEQTAANPKLENILDRLPESWKKKAKTEEAIDAWTEKEGPTLLTKLNAILMNWNEENLS